MPRLPDQTYLEISLSGKRLNRKNQRNAEVFFAGLGIESGRLVSAETKRSFKIFFYTRSFSELKKIRRDFAAAEPKGLRLKVLVLGRRDWLDKWKLYYRPTAVAKRFVVVPQWERPRFRPGNRIPLYLDPGGAFGSGLHETTRLVIRAMEKCSVSGKTFLDIGTGTGILSITAAKLGAAEICAFDSDPQSVRVAKNNFKLNRCINGRFLRADLTRFPVRRCFDLVAANLLSRTLTDNRRKILSAVKPGGTLLVSGIHRINLRGFLAFFPASSAFAGRKIFNGRSWSAILWKRLQ